jgi:hypothetical protein
MKFSLPRAAGKYLLLVLLPPELHRHGPHEGSNGRCRSLPRNGLGRAPRRHRPLPLGRPQERFAQALRGTLTCRGITHATACLAKGLRRVSCHVANNPLPVYALPLPRAGISRDDSWDTPLPPFPQSGNTKLEWFYAHSLRLQSPSPNIPVLARVQALAKNTKTGTKLLPNLASHRTLRGRTISQEVGVGRPWW